LNLLESLLLESNRLLLESRKHNTLSHLDLHLLWLWLLYISNRLESKWILLLLLWLHYHDWLLEIHLLLYLNLWLLIRLRYNHWLLLLLHLSQWIIRNSLDIACLRVFRLNWINNNRSTIANIICSCCCCLLHLKLHLQVFDPLLVSFELIQKL